MSILVSAFVSLNIAICFALKARSELSQMQGFAQLLETRKLRSRPEGVPGVYTADWAYLMTDPTYFDRIRTFRHQIRWWPLVTAVAAFILHVIIETNFVSYHFSPEDISPWPIWLLFRGLVASTIVLSVVTFPRWQTFISLLILGYIWLSTAGR